MLKKHLRSLVILAFTFTFVVPFFVGVNTSDAGPTQVFRQDWLTEFFCPDGTYATRSSGTHVKEFYHRHPPGKYGDWATGRQRPILPNGPHPDHSTTYYYNETLDYTQVTLWNNRNYCD